MNAFSPPTPDAKCWTYKENGARDIDVTLFDADADALSDFDN